MALHWRVIALVIVSMFLSACATLQPVDLDVETALAPASDPLWSELVEAREGDWVHLLNTGEQGIEWRLRAIDSATQSLDLQTFLWKDDPVGLAFLRHIYAAAERGVKVRLLLDDTFTATHSEAIWDIDQHPNIEFRIYNPFGRRSDSIAMRQILNISDFGRLDHRMHNKAMMVDNRVAIIGGRNLADEYFGAHQTANFRDMELIIAGPSVVEASQLFDEFWNNRWSFPIEMVLPEPPPEWDPIEYKQWLVESVPMGLVEDNETRKGKWLKAAQTGIPGKVMLLADHPAPDDPATELPDQLAGSLVEWIESAEKELILVSAYLIPTPELEEAVERIEKRGVEVRILTNSLQSNNHVAAHSAYRHHIRKLVAHGADIHEVRARAEDRHVYMQKPIEGKELGLHAKLLLIDDDLTFIGSANLDARSLRLNTEMGLLIRSEPLNRLVRESITMDFEEGNAWRLLQDEDGGIIWVSGETILRSQPSASTFRRIEDWFFSILPIEGEM